MTNDERAYHHAKRVIDDARARGDMRSNPEILRGEADRLEQLHNN